MSVNNKEFKELLKDKGLKLTTQRRAVLEVLQQHDGEHLTTEQIYDFVKSSCPEIGLATVYRTVQLLEQMNIIRKLSFDDGFNRYEIGNANEDHYHHHLICEECGVIIEVEEDLLGPIEEKIQQKYCFEVKDHKLKFYGLCSECKEN